MKLLRSKKGFLDDLLDLGWTLFFIIAIAFIVYGFSNAVTSSVKRSVADQTIDINRDIVLLNYLRTPVESDGKELTVLDWLDNILLKGGDTIGECRRILGPKTFETFMQKGGYSGYALTVELEGYSSPLCEFRAGAVGGTGVSILELPSAFPDKKLTIRLFSVETVEVAYTI